MTRLTFRLSFALVLEFLLARTQGLQTTTSPNALLSGRLGEAWGKTCPVPGLLGIIPEVIASAAPWSHTPRCITVPPANINATERQDCLFTAATLRSGHGTSIITSPNVASDIVGLGGLADRPLPLAAAKREALGPAYQVVDVPGKGKGMVARRRIRQGEIVTIDYPAVVVAVSFLTDAKPHHRRRLIKQALAQLPDETRKEVYGLYKGRGMYEVDAILGPNSHVVMLGEDESHMGLFPKVARINHSCRPNVFYRFSQRRLTLELISYTAIEPGEEIVMSYVPLSAKRDERRQYLKANYGFDCGCSLCHASEVDITDSEGRRRQLGELIQTMQDARRDGFYKDAITIANDWLQFGQWENVPHLLPEYYDILTDLYYLNGDMANATRYARMALYGWAKFGSVDDERLENAKEALHGLSALAERG